ncbi:MAG: c-type cytochrome [Candidatus Hydrogenedentes bacterium]|nr:c-type cytochrome [Candidatus Hydrogenedentota bacterium]
MTRRYRAACAYALACGIFLCIPGAYPEDLLPPAAPPPSTPELLERGGLLFAKECAACHGAEGRGDGPAAYLLYPKPRNLVDGDFRIVSTWERLPTDQDLFATISRGMPGSAMPPTPQLSAEDRWGLVHYVKSLSPRAWPGGIGASGAAAAAGNQGLIAVPPVPELTQETRERAAKLFADGCAACHGTTGRGDGQQAQFDSDGFPTRPRDLTKGIYKGPATHESVYRRIVAGIPGTPMPMSDWASGEQAALLAQYVLELSSREQRAAYEPRRETLTAFRSDHIPGHPDSREWQSAAPLSLRITPLWWRDDSADRVTVRAMHDGSEIAIQLVWTDATNDHTAIRAEDFRDAAAIQMSPNTAPPFIGMGAKDSPVNIWMWKSERQASLETAFQDIETVYPNIGIDSYPNPETSPLEQPARHALTLKSAPVFVTGWGARNIVSDPTYRLSAEDLNARGFGTLSACPLEHQAIAAIGRYDTSTYSVTFKRSLRSANDDQLDLKPGATVSIAFAVWDGSNGDRDGKKSVTIWHELKIQP